MRTLQKNTLFKGVSESKLFQQAVLNRRRSTLKKILLQHMGFNITREQPELRLEDVDFAGLGDELRAVMEGLGIELKEIETPANSIEIEVNGVAIVLDEEYKFNEFRLQTLQSPVYCLPLIYNLNRYKSYCQQKSDTLSLQGTGRAAKDRPYLQKKSSPASRKAKLQAINDFMHDLLPLVHFVPVLRLSVFDQLESPQGLVTLNSLLMEEKPENFELLAGYLIQQFEELEEVFNMEY